MMRGEKIGVENLDKSIVGPAGPSRESQFHHDCVLQSEGGFEEGCRTKHKGVEKNG